MSTTATELKPNIVHDLRSAMPGETKSYLEYQAYADRAERSGHQEMAKVWRIISHVERYDHFYHEAELHGYTDRDNARNLQISMELAQHHHQQFSQFAQQAQSDGSPEVASICNQVAQDAQRNHDRFQQALNGLQGNGTMPQGPMVSGTKIEKSQGMAQGKTHENLKEGLKTTAFAWGLYWIFARRAVSTGKPDLGVLFLDTAHAERADHFNRLASLFGLVGDDATNLKTSIHGETEAHQHYQTFTQQAQQEGNQRAAKFFSGAADDEAHHKEDFETLLRRLQGQS